MRRLAVMMAIGLTFTAACGGGDDSDSTPAGNGLVSSDTSGGDDGGDTSTDTAVDTGGDDSGDSSGGAASESDIEIATRTFETIFGLDTDRARCLAEKAVAAGLDTEDPTAVFGILAECDISMQDLAGTGGGG